MFQAKFKIWLLLSVFPSSSLSFDPREATVFSTHQSLYTGLTTCREVVSSFISRIEELNDVVNAVVSLDPDSLDLADKYDVKLKANNESFGPLFCIPILLKDNYDTANVPTTGGSMALANSRPSSDAKAVVELKKAGAVILGKTNLHELALEGLTVSSLGGQTINPYDFTRSPGGSSGGSSAAVAASLAVLSVGSDTVNSLRSPASANSLFSCRPTWGLISRSGIMPNSYTQDAIGPIARCVEDVAVALTVMANIGYDPMDNATASIPPGVHGIDYVKHLTSGSLRGLRLGLVKTFFNNTPSDETTPVNDAFRNIILKLETAGVEIVGIDDSLYNSQKILETMDTQRYEFRESMDEYLKSPSLKGQHPLSLKELYSIEGFLVIPAQYGMINTALISSTSNHSGGVYRSYGVVKQSIANLKVSLQETFITHHLDALIYPQQKNLVVKLGSPSQSGRNGILAAVTGSPVLTVPIGFSPTTKSAPEGVPIGMEILGRPWNEEKLLQIAYQIQELGEIRKPPRWAREAVSVNHYLKVPDFKPNPGNIPAQYPLGRLSH